MAVAAPKPAQKDASEEQETTEVVTKTKVQNTDVDLKRELNINDAWMIIRPKNVTPVEVPKPVPVVVSQDVTEEDTEEVPVAPVVPVAVPAPVVVTTTEKTTTERVPVEPVTVTTTTTEKLVRRRSTESEPETTSIVKSSTPVGEEDATKSETLETNTVAAG